MWGPGQSAQRSPQLEVGTVLHWGLGKGAEGAARSTVIPESQASDPPCRVKNKVGASSTWSVRAGDGHSWQGLVTLNGRDTSDVLCNASYPHLSALQPAQKWL